MGRSEEITTITVSGVRPGEALEVITLIHACGLGTDDITDELLRHFLIARQRGRIVGAIGLETAGTDALLRSLAVTPKSRNQGVRNLLLASIQRYARSQELRMLYLLAPTAETFFTDRGFEPTSPAQVPQGIRSMLEFKHLCTDTAVCLRKRLARRE